MCGIQKTEKPNKTSAPLIIVNISVIAITIVNISLQLLFFKGSLIDCREWLSEKYFSVFPLCFFSQRPLTLNWENQLDCQTTEWSIVFSVFGNPLSTRWLYYGSEEIYFDPKETEGTCLWMESGRWRLKTPLTTENMALSKAAAAAAGLRFTLHNQHPVWATLEQVEIKWKCSSFWCIAMSPSLAVWGLVSFVLGLLECLCRYSAMPPLFPASTDLALPPPSTNFSFASPKDTGNLLTCSQSWSKIWSFITTFQFSEK